MCIRDSVLPEFEAKAQKFNDEKKYRDDAGDPENDGSRGLFEEPGADAIEQIEKIAKRHDQADEVKEFTDVVELVACLVVLAEKLFGFFVHS